MPGLSGVVDAQLGRSLDKAQQCSSWHVRPLTREQVRDLSMFGVYNTERTSRISFFRPGDHQCWKISKVILPDGMLCEATLTLLPPQQGVVVKPGTFVAHGPSHVCADPVRGR